MHVRTYLLGLVVEALRQPALVDVSIVAAGVMATDLLKMLI